MRSRLIIIRIVTGILLLCCSFCKQVQKPKAENLLTTTHEQKHGAVPIGRMEEPAAPFITMNSSTMDSMWNATLNTPIKFYTFKIILTSEGNYNLTGTNKNNTITAAIGLFYDAADHNFYEEMYEANSLSVSCTTCPIGCFPVLRDGVGYCLPACEPCTKSVTQKPGPIFK